MRVSSYIYLQTRCRRGAGLEPFWPGCETDVAEDGEAVQDRRLQAHPVYYRSASRLVVVTYVPLKGLKQIFQNFHIRIGLVSGYLIYNSHVKWRSMKGTYCTTYSRKTNTKWFNFTFVYALFFSSWKKFINYFYNYKFLILKS